MRLKPRSASANFGARDLLGAEDAHQVSWLLMARPLGALWFGGGSVVELWLALHGGAAAAPWLALAVALAAQCLGAVIAVSARRVPPAWTGHAILLAANTAITLVLLGTRPADSGLELIYLWATPYAFILVAWRWAVAYVLTGAAMWIAHLALLPADGTPVGRWLVALATLAAISLVSGHLIVFLRGSHQLLNRAVEDSPLGLGFTDADGRWIALNRALADLLGRAPQDVTGSPAAAILGDLSQPGPRPVATGDGREVWVEVVHAPVHDDAGHVACWSLQVLDVSERHDAEAALRADAAQARWVDEVRAALDEDRILLYAQPLFSIRRGVLVGHEILARLRLRDGTIVAPGSFMPAVERFGLAPQLDAYVLAGAARLAAAGRPLHVNLSAQSVGRPETLSALRRALEDAGADPALLTLEITETALTGDREACVAFGRDIAALGCRLSLDDFGTGYGTLTYLASLPISEIKIDRQFVSRLTADQSSVEIVRAVVGLARSFHATTVAEGVEDEATLELVRGLGVDVAQGYLLGRPAPFGVPAAGPPRRVPA